MADAASADAASAAAGDDAATGAGAFRLTAINDEGDRVVAEPESMSRVRELHDQLAGVVHMLNSKVSRVLHKQEQEFLSAYRGHMYSVQRELQTWKDKADAARLRQERDQRMQRLTEECAWFRKEALRLNKFNAALKRDTQLLRERLGAVEEDRQWLDRQLKAAKKDNKLLRAELEVRMTEPSEAAGVGPRSSLFLTQTGAADVDEGGSVSAAAHPVSPEMSASLRSSGVLPPLGMGAMAGRGAARAGEASGASGRGARLTGRAAAQVAKMEAQVARLTAQLQAERGRGRRSREAEAAAGRARRDLQRTLAECVDAVRSERRQRRAGGAAAARTAADVGGSGLGGEDKRLVVRRLLEDDLVLEALHRTIFGHGEGEAGAEADAEAGAGDRGGGSPAAEGKTGGRGVIRTRVAAGPGATWAGVPGV